jgi:hypothetical protein
MPRVSEFEWSAPRKSRRKHWLTVLLVGAGLGTGYFFVQSGREAYNNSLPLTAAVDPQVSRPLQGPAHNEASAIADAARTGEREPAQNEPSAIAAVPVQVEIINAPPPESAAQPNFPSPALRSEHERSAMAPDYASLRREMLRHVP